jgi:hypothetical protein
VGGLRAGYLRFEHERHSIFYQKTGTGILVVRVLHHRMRRGSTCDRRVAKPVGASQAAGRPLRARR